MSTVPVVMGDPEAECVAVLEAEFDVEADTVEVSYPSTALAGTGVWLQVELETGDVADYPVTERAQVRVTVHVPNGRRTLAKEAADRARSALAAWAGNAAVASITPAGGRSRPTEDPDTGNLMCWFLVRVNLTGRLRPS